MKNYNQFINNQINEGLFDWVKNMFKKAQEAYRKVQGGNDIKTIHDKYKQIIDDQIKKQTNVDLELKGEEQSVKDQPTDSGNTNESLYIRYTDFINEAKVKPELKVDSKTDEQPTEEVKPEVDPKTDEQPTEETDEQTNKKMDASTLKKKSQLIQKIIDLNVTKALKEMDAVLARKGGAEKNPQLKILIDLQKDEFQMDYLNAQIKYLEKSGDKTSIKKVTDERNKLAKTVNDKLGSIVKGETPTTAEIETKVDNFSTDKVYRYNTKKGVKLIKVTKKDDKSEDKIIGTYISSDFGKTNEQPFQLKNILKSEDFKPTTGEKYNYLNLDGDEIKVVELLGDPNEQGIVKVKTPNDKEIEVNINRFTDKVE